MVKERAIILRKIKYGESDLIIHCINTVGAKVAYMAKGALKSKKRFAGGVLDPFHFVEFSLNRKNSESGHISAIDEARIIEEFSGIKSDYSRLEMGFYLLECIYKVAQEGEQHSETLFNLLGHSLKILQTFDNLPLLKLGFDLKLLYQQGVLQIEPWMHEVLKTPMSQLQVVESQVAQDKSESVGRQVKQYLLTATVD